MLAYVLLALAVTAGLLMIPFGAPGLWLELAALSLYGWRTGFTVIGPALLVVFLFIVLAAELIEATLLVERIDPKTRRRIGLAGLAGGGAGAALGVPFPLIGSMFGAYLGALLGTLLGSFRLRQERAGCLTMGGQVIAVSTKTAAGVVIAAFTLLILAR